MTMPTHAVFIWSSYVIAALAFGALAVASLLAHRKARREIAEHGLEKKR